VDDARGNGELALHAFGVDAELAPSRLLQGEHPQEFAGPGVALAFAHAVERGAEAQVFEAGELRIEVALVRDNADELQGRPGSFRAVHASDANRPGVRSGQPGEHVDGRCLARPVRAEKTEDFAQLHGEGNPVHGLDLAEAFAQVLDDDGVLHHDLPAPPALAKARLSENDSADQRLPSGGRSRGPKFPYLRKRLRISDDPSALPLQQGVDGFRPLGQGGFTYPVMHMEAPFLGRDHACIPQHPQMLRDRGRGDLQLPGQGVDAVHLAPEQCDDSHAGPHGQDLEYPSESFGRFRRRIGF